MKNIKKLLAFVVVILGLVPNVAVLAESKDEIRDIENSNIIENSVKVNTTTQSAVDVSYDNSSLDKDSDLKVEKTTQAAVIVNDFKIEKLEVETKGELEVGKTIFVSKVIGYNTEGEKVNLNKHNLKYRWFADDEVVGTNKELKITDKMKGKVISINVDYKEGEEGNE